MMPRAQMDARRAYEALILGKLASDRRLTYPTFRRRVLSGPNVELIRAGRLTREDELVLAEAREFASASCKRRSHEHPFDSIYDLLLFHEFVAIVHGPSRDRGAHVYRG